MSGMLSDRTEYVGCPCVLGADPLEGEVTFGDLWQASDMHQGGADPLVGDISIVQITPELSADLDRLDQSITSLGDDYAKFVAAPAQAHNDKAQAAIAEYQGFMARWQGFYHADQSSAWALSARQSYNDFQREYSQRRTQFTTLGGSPSQPDVTKPFDTNVPSADDLGKVGKGLGMGFGGLALFSAVAFGAYLIISARRL